MLKQLSSKAAIQARRSSQRERGTRMGRIMTGSAAVGVPGSAGGVLGGACAVPAISRILSDDDSRLMGSMHAPGYWKASHLCYPDCVKVRSCLVALPGTS